MSGVSSTGSPATKNLATALLRAAACLLFLGTPFAAAQTFTPTTPVLPADPTAPSLPTDSTAPPTVDTSTHPSIPLIPAQPLPTSTPFPGASNPFSDASNPFSPPNVFPPPPNVAGTLPGSSLNTGTAETAAKPLPDGITTNNIGTARRFQYNFALTLGTTYDDNIFLTRTQQESDVYFTIQPSVSLGFGGGVGGSGEDNFIRFTYSPQVLLYTNNGNLDTIQHFITLSGTYHLPRITLTGSQSVEILDSTDVGNPHPFDQTISLGNQTNPQTGAPVVNNPVSNVNLDAGQRTKLNVYNTSLNGNYYVSDKVSYDASLQFSENDYQTLLSSTTLSGSFFFNYTPTGKTTVGLGVTGGYVFSDAPTPDQSFEQGNLRFSYNPSPKLSAAGQVGLELRQSSGKSGSDETPIFNLTASYSLFDGTSISLDGSRQVETSATIGGQDYTTTGFTVSFSQRFFQRAFLRLSAGFTNTAYVAETKSTNAGLSQNYFFVQPGLDINLRDNLTLGGFYSFRSNTANQNNRDFTDNQVGVRLSFSF